MPRIIVPAIAASLLAAFIVVPAAAQNGPAPSAPYAYCGGGGGMGGGMGRFLTPEQRMMHRSEMQHAMASMSFNQMRDYRKSVHDKIWNMSPAERERFAADLTKKWNALTPAQRAEIQNRMAYCGHGRGWGRHHGHGRHGGWGRGQGRGDGWGGGNW